MPRRSMRRSPRRLLQSLLRILLIAAGVVVGLAVMAALGGTLALRRSLPRLEGSLALNGLSAPAIVIRDDHGVPDIEAANRLDAACVLGYLHAQDRFFQMDLQRRSAAGELAALLGPALLPTDRDTRRHRFRDRAEAVVAGLPEADRNLLSAYATGVNAGLDDLGSRPFEYWALRQAPEHWRPADTVLTQYAMFLDLSLSTASTEAAWAVVADQLPPALAALLLPRGNRWEAPLQDGSVSGVVLPDSADVDVRQWKFDGKTWDQAHQARLDPPPAPDTAGSNNWAVAGALTGHGGALLANDMHLGLGLPNIWYRARLRWPDVDGLRDVVGVTLPGTPAVVAGSNGHVAWGFTNSYGDWADLVILETDSTATDSYRTPGGWRDIRRTPEVITVAGAKPDTLWVAETIWGPVWATDSRGRRLALRWTAHDTATVNLNLMRLETVTSVDDVVALAGGIGIPQQNLVCADADGRIAWTIVGAIPRRVGWDGRLPVSWADGSCRWDGYLDPARQPHIVDPAEGRLWTANNRVAAGADLAVIGDGGYGLGARARQIRDGLRALDHPREAQMLALQLDDRAVFLAEWRDLALGALERRPRSSGMSPGTPRAEFARIVGEQWSGRADTTSVAYRLVRNFAFGCIDGVYGLLARDCAAADSNFRTYWLPYRHAVAWEVISARPPHLLPPQAADWDDFLLQAVDQVMADAGPDPTVFTWGARNVVQVAHPFTQMFPQLSRWLAAPAEALPGDSYMPRVQHRTSGASERMVVSPGREQDGLFHMPGGQSGHPLSPYFLAGHDDWAAGRATPLLPGPGQHRLRLEPGRGIR